MDRGKSRVSFYALFRFCITSSCEKLLSALSRSPLRFVMCKEPGADAKTGGDEESRMRFETRTRTRDER